MLSKECGALFCFFVTFNIIISYIFPGNFMEIHQVSQEIRIFVSSILTIFVNFLDFFYLYLLKKLMVSASIR